MALPSPNLDDRTWQDILEEAKKMIPSLCPQWTDFNPSDPGMTLVELMAWLAEMMIYRLNRVPEKNYIKFMELMGVTLKPPIPANTWLVFQVAQGAGNVDLPIVPANTPVSGKDPAGETVTFETQHPLNLTASRLNRIFTQQGESYLEQTDHILSHAPSMNRNIFLGGQPIPHIFYLGHSDIDKTGEDFKLSLYLTLKTPGTALSLEWSYWNGKSWHIIMPKLDETARWSQSGRMDFMDLEPMKPREIRGINGFWLRIKLKNVPQAPLPEIQSLKMALELEKKTGIVPQKGYLSTRDISFLPVAMQGPFYPFGREARENDSLYISSEAFSRPNAPVTIDIALALSYKPPPINDIRNLQVAWEYYTHKGEWQILGLTSPEGVLQSRSGFSDKTEAFTHSGRVSFYVPRDISILELMGEKAYWIRIRIRNGSYRRPAIKLKELIKEQDKPPLVTRFVVFFKEQPFFFQQYMAYNEFEFQDFKSLVSRQISFSPFTAVTRNKPELYLGFDLPFSNRLHHLYFRLSGSGKPGARINWEYSTKEGWQSLNLVEDETHHLTREGLVGLIGPMDWVKKNRFEMSAYWLRLTWESYKEDDLPNIRCIHQNIVRAINARSYRGEIIGSGNGQPFQTLSFREAPILPGSKIYIKELETAIPQEIGDFRKQVKEPVHEEMISEKTRTKALWVEWQEVDNFFFSKWNSRHYMIDIYNGTITFGDAVRGSIPPIGAEIKANIYYRGGGTRGNMERGAINNLETAIPYIDRVSNPYPASGGKDMETLEEVKLRAPWELKHRQRVVTAADYENLALQAADVARVICLPDDAGKVTLVIIPKGEQAKLLPTDALKASIRAYLDKRRLLTTVIELIGPGYRDFTVKTSVKLKKEKMDKFPQIRQRMEKRLREFMHPLTGGMAGTGWPIGRSVYLSDLYHVIDTLQGIDHTHELIIDNFPGKDKIEIGPYEFPYISDITITLADD